jgi:integrase
MTTPTKRTLQRPPITPRVRRRIADAVQLLAGGLTMNESAVKLGVPTHRLSDYHRRHGKVWDSLLIESLKDACEVLRSSAGDDSIFRNQGKLIRMAALGAEQQAKPLFARADGKRTLAEFLEDVFLPSRIEVSAQYAANLCAIVRRLDAFLGCAVALDELNETDLCRYLSAYKQSACAITVNNNRRSLLTLWRAAWDEGLTDRPPRMGRIRRLPEEYSPPEAWTAEECNLLFSAAAEWPGMVGNIPAGQWWLSLLFTVYWTGCRIGALIHVPTAAYKDGRLLVRRQKNHRPQLYFLPASCCEAIDATRPAGRELLWPWPLHSTRLFATFRKIVEKAGVAHPPGGRQLFHRLRRTTLSLCAAVDPAIAQRQGGHADYATTLKSYIDPRISRGRTAADVLPEPIITPTLDHYTASCGLT